MSHTSYFRSTLSSKFYKTPLRQKKCSLVHYRYSTLRHRHYIRCRTIILSCSTIISRKIYFIDQRREEWNSIYRSESLSHCFVIQNHHQIVLIDDTFLLYRSKPFLSFPFFGHFFLALTGTIFLSLLWFFF